MGDRQIGGATIGGFVVVGEEELALTVAHAFGSQEEPESEQSYELDESELGFWESPELLADDDSDASDLEFVDEADVVQMLTDDSDAVPDADIEPLKLLFPGKKTGQEDVTTKITRNLIGHPRWIASLATGSEGCPTLDWG